MLLKREYTYLSKNSFNRPPLLTVFLSTPFHKLPSVKPYSILMTLRRTVLNDGDESSFDLSRPSSPWLCRNDGPTRECLDSDEQKNQFIILSLNWNEALVKVIQRLCFMNELKRINIMNFIVHVSTINKKGTMKI